MDQRLGEKEKFCLREWASEKINNLGKDLLEILKSPTTPVLACCVFAYFFGDNVMEHGYSTNVKLGPLDFTLEKQDDD